jgi:hypothetical protein
VEDMNENHDFLDSIGRRIRRNKNLLKLNADKVYGIKGGCIMNALEYFDQTECTTFEILHDACEGIFEDIIHYVYDNKPDELLDETKNIKIPSMFHLETINLKPLKAIKSFIIIMYLYRNLKKHLNHNQYVTVQMLRNFMEHVLQPVKLTTLPMLQLEIRKVRSNVEMYFGESFMKSKFHKWLHIPDNIRDTGPIYLHNGFIMENCVGLFLKNISGTFMVGKKTITSMDAYKLSNLFKRIKGEKKSHYSIGDHPFIYHLDHGYLIKKTFLLNIKKISFNGVEVFIKFKKVFSVLEMNDFSEEVEVNMDDVSLFVCFLVFYDDIYTLEKVQHSIKYFL